MIEFNREEMLPRGPALTPRIRAYADEKLGELKSSNVLNNRIHFFKWMESMTNEILGIGEHVEILVSNNPPHEKQKRKHTKAPSVYIGDEFRVPSHKSLSKLQSLRTSISRDEEIPNIYRTLRNGYYEDTSSIENPNFNESHINGHYQYQSNLDSTLFPHRSNGRVNYETNSNVPYKYHPEEYYTRKDPRVINLGRLDSSPSVSENHPKGEYADPFLKDLARERTMRSRLTDRLKTLYLECFWVRNRRNVDEGGRNGSMSSELANEIPAMLLTREMLSYRDEITGICGDVVFECLTAKLLSLGERTLSLSDFLNHCSNVTVSAITGEEAVSVNLGMTTAALQERVQQQILQQDDFGQASEGLVNDDGYEGRYGRRRVRFPVDRLSVKYSGIPDDDVLGEDAGGTQEEEDSSAGSDGISQEPALAAGEEVLESAESYPQMAMGMEIEGASEHPRTLFEEAILEASGDRASGGENPSLEQEDKGYVSSSDSSTDSNQIEVTGRSSLVQPDEDPDHLKSEQGYRINKFGSDLRPQQRAMRPPSQGFGERLDLRAMDQTIRRQQLSASALSGGSSQGRRRSTALPLFGKGAWGSAGDSDTVDLSGMTLEFSKEILGHY